MAQEQDPLVYVKHVALENMSPEVRECFGDQEFVYAIHDENGKPLALTGSRKGAFSIARRHDMRPISVH